MDKPEPMDRLVCGDVGFGKTEVALRAAFRAASEGRQVALLCPTTVLAEQHYQTFRARLAGFPVTVGLLSRFVPRARQRKSSRQRPRGDRHPAGHAPPAVVGCLPAQSFPAHPG